MACRGLWRGLAMRFGQAPKNQMRLDAIALKEIAFLVNIRNNRRYEVVAQDPVSPVGRELLAAPKESFHSCRCSDLLQVVVARVS